MREAILTLPESAWQAALAQGGKPRDNGEVAEITDQLALAHWPEGSRVIVRRVSVAVEVGEDDRLRG